MNPLLRDLTHEQVALFDQLYRATRAASAFFLAPSAFTTAQIAELGKQLDAAVAVAEGRTP